ncbi:MAG: Luciferase [Verrucomicrobiaceae bacterium]|nr:Luciferase [Verrucomicrobiaceae bacterium]
MRIGVVFPQTEIGADPIAIRDFAQAAEANNFDFIAAYDHIVGASAAAYDKQRLQGPYRERHMFHEPLVLFGYLAGVTQRIELVTGILILPQRQTVLVAKQAAQVDVLSGGRLRLGVGSGWNDVEYTALGVPFAQRGKRLEQQVKLLRELWTQPLVEFNGEFDVVPNAGLNPLPIQQPIPIWFGGSDPRVIKRVGEIGDGWMPLFKQFEPGMSRALSAELPPADLFEQMREHARTAGRDASTIGIECRLSFSRQTEDDWQRTGDIFSKAGATHLALVTMNAGLSSPDQHIAAMVRMRAALN